MKKMTTGAILTGLGVALLLGGGGTLAVWNAEATSETGTIAAGNLDLKAEAGTWRNGTGKKIDVTSYKIVPGETLTYTQPVTVTLSGDRMVAKLTQHGSGIASAESNGFDTASIEVSPVKLTTARGAAVPNELTPKTNGNFVASTSFTFNDVSGQTDVLKEYEFSQISYVLDQQPVSN
ncbi:MAG: alternate-type signal peptide domain-containing protein [Micrococcus sp.]|nr:alternate-type signal peptide domain-containing protein [Micrococcus sp.]